MSIGSDCSAAATLRNLNLKSEALPFDWVDSNLNKIIKCIEDNFKYYHTNLTLKTMVIIFYMIIGRKPKIQT